MKYILMILICITGTVASLGAMDNKEQWIRARADEILKEESEKDKFAFQTKSQDEHRGQLLLRGGTAAFFGLVFHKEYKTFGWAAIKGLFFVLSLLWFISEIKNPSRAIVDEVLYLYRQSKRRDWPRRQAEKEWEKRQHAEGVQQEVSFKV